MKNSKLILLALGLSACISIDKGYAEEQAKQYAADLGMTDAKVNCVNTDSNSDGYVSCTIAVPRKDGGKPDMQAVECAAKMSGGCGNLNNGCRIPKGRLATETQ